jgi:hypothetical protein
VRRDDEVVVICDFSQVRLTTVGSARSGRFRLDSGNNATPTDFFLFCYIRADGESQICSGRTTTPCYYQKTYPYVATGLENKCR